MVSGRAKALKQFVRECWYMLPVSLLLALVIELLNHHTPAKLLAFLMEHPWMFLFNVEIIFNTFLFAELFRRQWLMENRPAGLDAFDVRIGGLKERLCSASARMEGWLTGEVSSLEELEQPRLPYEGKEIVKGREDLPSMHWNNIILPSEIGAI